MDEAFLQRLLAAFRIEADEHLQALSAGLLEMERLLTPAESGSSEATPEQMAKLIEIIFREAHSLKGAARAVNFDDIETICQALEGVFSDWKSGEVPDGTQGNALFDPLHAGIDTMQAVLSASLAGQAPLPGTQLLAIVNRIKAIQDAPPREATDEVPEHPPLQAKDETVPLNGAMPGLVEPLVPATALPGGGSAENTVGMQGAAPDSAALFGTALSGTAPSAPTSTTLGGASETIRIATDKLDTLLLQAEEMLSLKMTAQQRALELRELAGDLTAWRKEGNKATEGMRSASPNQDLGRKLDRLDQQQHHLRAIENKLRSLANTAERDRHAVNGLVDTLLVDTKKLSMQPFSTVLAIFPKLVRDVARQLGKEVEFKILGGEVEIDKRILEEMKAPLTHLLRNAVDHGLEQPEERRQNGKPAQGHLQIGIQQSGGRVQIEISDDGDGIALDAVKAAAIKNGSLTPAEAARLDDESAIQLIFRSAVSTSPIVTELSGRGLGMAIVREKVENLGGDIAVETCAGKGTTFQISLPLTLATFRGLLVLEASQLFVIPTLGIERVLRVRQEEIQTVEGRPTISVGGEVIALRELREVLGAAGEAWASPTNGFYIVVVLGSAGEHVAFRVREILEEQEVLLKSFEKPLTRVRHFAGATVLGSGRVAPVLLIADLLQTARSTGGGQSMLSSSAHGRANEAQRTYKVLVADDSITSRMLLKNILEAAGYNVQTAVDGQDAITTLRAGEFDLLVSDVDMPRLSGFDLTEQVRADARLAGLPVVLVTGRETRQDREKGIDVGASAYVVKSSFDQNNLLEVVEGLL